MKLLQHMSLGIWPICTPLGANVDVVEHGVNGLLAETADDWDRGVDRLVTEPDLMSALGQRAVETAHARYALQARAGDIVEAFRAAVA